MICPGRYHDGHSAVAHAVSVEVEAETLQIHDDSGRLLARWPLAEVTAGEVLPGRGDMPLRCRSMPDARLMVDGARFPRHRLPRQGRGSGRRGLLLAGVVGLGVLVGLYLGLPWLVRQAAERVPPAMEAALGEHLVEGFERHYGRCRGEAGQQALDKLVGRLAAGLPPERRPAAVRMVAGPQPNAITLPGGQIIVFKGLLPVLHGPDELAGILAHEVTHVGERHAMSATIRAGGLGLLVGISVGDTSGAVAGGLMAALASSYSRDDEAAADRGAVELLRRAGIGRAGFAAFFRTVATDPALHGGLPPWLSSHPDPALRAELIERSDDDRAASPALSNAEWAAVRAMCGAK